MVPRFVAAVSALSILLVFTFIGLQHSGVSASPQELTVKSWTKGYEGFKAGLPG
jgi:hypothetical protein